MTLVASAHRARRCAGLQPQLARRLVGFRRRSSLLEWSTVGAGRRRSVHAGATLGIRASLRAAGPMGDLAPMSNWSAAPLKVAGTCTFAHRIGMWLAKPGFLCFNKEGSGGDDIARLPLQLVARASTLQNYALPFAHAAFVWTRRAATATPKLSAAYLEGAEPERPCWEIALCLPPWERKGTRRRPTGTETRTALPVRAGRLKPGSGPRRNGTGYPAGNGPGGLVSVAVFGSVGNQRLRSQATPSPSMAQAQESDAAHLSVACRR